MEVFECCGLQIGLLILLLFVGYLDIKDGGQLNRVSNRLYCNRYFDALFITGEVAVLLDGVTKYTVNHLQSVPLVVNDASHLLYLLAYQLFSFVHFMYWLSVTESLPRTNAQRVACFAPIALTCLFTAAFMPSIVYVVGETTNYASGIPAYLCFGAVGLYDLFALGVFAGKSRFIRRNRRTAYVLALSTVIIITLMQMIFRELLVASIGVALVVVSLYLCMEDPSVKYREYYHSEMIMGFATLVENKDNNTGGHIRRSSAYASLIASQLRSNPRYGAVITRDYLDNLEKAAPMHDIGKISIPDRILQKPGSLDDEEWAIMRSHTVVGGQIIRETFGHLNDPDYEAIAFDVARFHHEKWNGRGYPDGLSKTEIPLSARIMAVADVFDAVSAKRCYRDAMPLEKCFAIIEEGSGSDFDPDVVTAFFARREDIERIYRES